MREQVYSQAITIGPVSSNQELDPILSAMMADPRISEITITERNFRIERAEAVVYTTMNNIQLERAFGYLFADPHGMDRVDREDQERIDGD